MKVPTLPLSCISNWEPFAKYKNKSFPGVYFIAYSVDEEMKKFSWSGKIIYIGKTKSKIRDRFYQFKTNTYKNKYDHIDNCLNLPQEFDERNLYISHVKSKTISGLHKVRFLREALIEFLEKRAFWDYYSRFKKLPCFNNHDNKNLNFR